MTRRRGRFALRSSVVAGLIAMAAMPSAASAFSRQASDPNPLATNVPYLAWRGEHVRLVKCTGDLPQSDMDAVQAADTRSGTGIWFPQVNADVLVEDWSGPSDFKPQVAPGTVDLFLSNDGLCIKADVISQKAGLAMLKLLVTIDQSSPLYDLFNRSDILGVHQFLVGWMGLNSPSLTELPVGGDAAALNNFAASDDPARDGVLRVLVTGTIPLGNNFTELGLGPSLTMPADWPRLAGALASDRNPDNATPAFRWDIHDDQTTVEGHPQYGPVNTTDAIHCNDFASTPPVTDVPPYGDAVDNCEGGRRFSRFFDADGPAGPLTPVSLDRTVSPTIGPFDPQRPDETFLPDGFLNADDAPMPAARIDVSIAPNTGAAGDTSGIGSLHRNSKQQWFSRDRLPTANAGSGDTTPHNLYAPFYSAYIPATANSGWDLFGDPVSGTDGPPQGNNFPGFLVGDGNGGEGDYGDNDNRYDYWDIAHVFSKALGGDTTCLHRIDNRVPSFRQLPFGPQSVAVYTDEHGMAQVDYRSGTGAFFDSLPIPDDANGGCDLKGIDVLGTSAITASAKYPYQPTTDIAPKLSATITKTVHSLFAKFVTVFPKGTSAETANARVLVAHAQDVDGSPEAGEVVCFVRTSANGSVQPYVYNGANTKVFGTPPGATFDVSGSTIASSDKHPGAVCMKTNQFGNAAVEVFESQHGVVDVVAYFVNEALLRDTLVDFSVPAPPGGTPTPPPVTTSSGTPDTPGLTGVPAPNANGNDTPSAAETRKVLTVLGKGTVKKHVKRAKVRFVRLVTAGSGKRALVIRLSATGRKATVRIRLYNAKGKILVTATRRVATGRTVRLASPRVTKAHVRATVKVIG